MFAKLFHRSMRWLMIASICIAYVLSIVPPEIIAL
jgi:hypothetical protein